MMEAKYEPGDTLTVMVKVREAIVGKDYVEYGVEQVDRNADVVLYIGRVPEEDVVNKVLS